MPDSKKEELVKQFFQNWTDALDGTPPRESLQKFVTMKLEIIDNDIIEHIVNSKYSFEWTTADMMELQKLRLLNEITFLLKQLIQQVSP